LTQQDDVVVTIQEKLFSLINDAVNISDIRNSSSFPEKEDVSVLDWVSLKGFPKDPSIQSLLSQLTSSIVGREPDEVGAHYFFDYVKSGLGLESLLTEGADGAQSLMIEEG
jgi:monoamine oxidase